MSYIIAQTGDERNCHSHLGFFPLEVVNGPEKHLVEVNCLYLI